MIVGLADAVLTNAVQRIDLKDICFGEYETQVITRTSGLMYPPPLTELFYQDPQDDEFYECRWLQLAADRCEHRSPVFIPTCRARQRRWPASADAEHLHLPVVPKAVGSAGSD